MSKFFLLVMVFIAIFGTSGCVYSQTVELQSPLSITAVVGSGTNTGGGGTGGGSVGSGYFSPTTVNFSGMGYPLAIIVILKDDQIAITTVAGPDAKFSATLSSLTPGTSTFSVYTEDKEGRRSVVFSFPLYITLGSTVNVSGIILSPTIDVDKVQVKKGDNLAIFGFGTPNSDINITVNSDGEHFAKAKSDSSGAYLYNFDTSTLEYGSHDASSRAILGDAISSESAPANFSVSTVSIKKNGSTPVPGSCSSIRGDINCDGRVNLIDFSIMSYWYKRSLPPANVDLSGDGVVNLVDFSILAYNWTG